MVSEPFLGFQVGLSVETLGLDVALVLNFGFYNQGIAGDWVILVQSKYISHLNVFPFGSDPCLGLSTVNLGLAMIFLSILTIPVDFLNGILDHDSEHDNRQRQ